MPVVTNMLFGRPRNCRFCGNGFYGLQHMVDYAISKGKWSVIDLQGAQANKDPIYAALDDHDPLGFYHFGHGNNCYDEKTQILTENGWRYFYELIDEKVATLNPETNKLEYHRPTEHISYFYDGEMFQQIGRNIDLLVTPEHNLYVSWMTHSGKSYRPYQFIKPLQLKNGNKKDEVSKRFIKTNTTCSHLKYKRDALWDGSEQERFILPKITKRHNGSSKSEYVVEKKILKMDDWLEFFGWWISEGSACLGYADKDKKYIIYRVSIAQNNDNNRKKIKNVAKRLGFVFQENLNPHSKNLEIRNKQLYNYLKQFGHSENKFIPTEIKNLSSRQLKIIFDALILGDGSTFETRFSYATKSKRLADDMQEISLKIGFAATINCDKNGLYTLSISTKDCLNPLCSKKGKNFLKYSGMVYCIEVANHIIYVRRNGKPVWCGNCVTTGDFEQPVFTCTECGKLAGRIVYLLSCLTANGLGPAIIAAGGKAYAGFNISWTWMMVTGTDGDPYDDIVGICFYESANELWKSLLDNNVFETACQQSRDKYTEWIEYWYEKGGPYASSAMMWLLHDRDGLVGLGDMSARLSPCEDMTTLEDCHDIGCFWYSNACHGELPQNIKDSKQVMVQTVETNSSISDVKFPPNVYENFSYEISYYVKNMGGDGILCGRIRDVDTDTILPDTYWEENLRYNQSKKIINILPNILKDMHLQLEVGHL